MDLVVDFGYENVEEQVIYEQREILYNDFVFDAATGTCFTQLTNYVGNKHTNDRKNGILKISNSKLSSFGTEKDGKCRKCDNKSVISLVMTQSGV